MTDKGHEGEIEILGCRIKSRPLESDRQIAQLVVNMVQSEVAELQAQRPNLSATDVAVLVALKMATDRVKLEQEFKTVVLRMEGSVEDALTQLQNRS